MSNIIELSEVVLNENKIKVACDHTLFCSVVNYEDVNIKELEKRIKALRKKAKENKIKLNKTNTIKLLKENKELYKLELEKYKNLYNLLLSNWKYAIENDILKVGYGSCEYYINNLRDVKFELDKMKNLGNILVKFKMIQNKVEELENEFEYEIEKFISVSI